MLNRVSAPGQMLGDARIHKVRPDRPRPGGFGASDHLLQPARLERLDVVVQEKEEIAGRGPRPLVVPLRERDVLPVLDHLHRKRHAPGLRERRRAVRRAVVHHHDLEAAGIIHAVRKPGEEFFEIPSPVPVEDGHRDERPFFEARLRPEPAPDLPRQFPAGHPAFQTPDPTPNPPLSGGGGSLRHFPRHEGGAFPGGDGSEEERCDGFDASLRPLGRHAARPRFALPRPVLAHDVVQTRRRRRRPRPAPDAAAKLAEGVSRLPLERVQKGRNVLVHLLHPATQRLKLPIPVRDPALALLELPPQPGDFPLRVPRFVPRVHKAPAATMPRGSGACLADSGKSRASSASTGCRSMLATSRLPLLLATSGS